MVSEDNKANKKFDIDKEYKEQCQNLKLKYENKYTDCSLKFKNEYETEFKNLKSNYETTKRNEDDKIDEIIIRMVKESINNVNTDSDESDTCSEFKTIPRIKIIKACNKVAKRDKMKLYEKINNEVIGLREQNNEEKLDEMIETEIKNNGGWLSHSFRGSDYCSKDCRGWDGESKRCDCGNIRLYWHKDARHMEYHMETG